MGRRRRNDTEQSNSSQFKTWKVGKYIRLSRDDGNSESESITNQRKILNEHIPDFFEDDYDIIDEYIDDGRTGTHRGAGSVCIALGRAVVRHDLSGGSGGSGPKAEAAT